MKVKNYSLIQIMGMVPKDFSLELLKEMRNWKNIIKSPYGFSFYSEEVGWGFKPHNSYRISDHWNFIAQFKLHCETTTECPNNTHWTLAKYDETLEKYVVISSIPKTKDFKNNLEAKLFFLELRKEKTIEKQKTLNLPKYKFEKIIKDIELHFLNQYFKAFESYTQ